MASLVIISQDFHEVLCIIFHFKTICVFYTSLLSIVRLVVTPVIVFNCSETVLAPGVVFYNNNAQATSGGFIETTNG